MKTEKRPEPTATGAPKTCPECSGRGWVDNRCLTPEQAHRCPLCNGRGTDNAGKQCFACHGTGLMEVRQVDRHRCSLCRGAGVYPVPASMGADEFAFRPGKR